MVANDTCPVPRAHMCCKQPLEAGTAAKGLRKPNLSHFSPETSAQAQQHCWRTTKASAPSTAPACSACIPNCSPSSPPLPYPSRWLLPIWIAPSFPFLSAITSGAITSEISVAGEPAGLQTFTPRAAQSACSGTAAKALGKGASQGPLSSALCKQAQPTPLLRETQNPLTRPRSIPPSRQL